MPLVTTLPEPDAAGQTVPLPLDRHSLQKRRWRVQAEDGVEIAVDLEEPCGHGTLIWRDGEKAYRVEQEPESVLLVPIPEDREQAAQLGWTLGNQHLPVEVAEGSMRLADDPKVREFLERKHIHFEPALKRFCPSPHSHHHHAH